LKLIITILFFVCSSKAFTQDSSFFAPAKTIDGEFSDFTVDNLGNYYLLSKDNQLKKLNNRGDSMGVFNDVRRYGKLYAMDVTNPLKVLLYYKNFSTVVVLDRFLNVVNTIDFRKANIFQVKAIAQSYDNNIWLYDEQNNKLKRIGEKGGIIFETGDLRIIFDEVPSPTHIFDHDGFVYLYDPEKGFYVFDIYGSFKTKISYKGLTDVTVIGKTILGIESKTIIAYTTGTLTEKRLPLPNGFTGYQKAVIQPGHLYLLQNNSIKHFTF
jgi:hypothetical protein